MISLKSLDTLDMRVRKFSFVQQGIWRFGIFERLLETMRFKDLKDFLVDLEIREIREIWEIWYIQEIWESWVIFGK